MSAQVRQSGMTAKPAKVEAGGANSPDRLFSSQSNHLLRTNNRHHLLALKPSYRHGIKYPEVRNIKLLPCSQTAIAVCPHSAVIGQAAAGIQSQRRTVKDSFGQKTISPARPKAPSAHRGQNDTPCRRSCSGHLRCRRFQSARTDHSWADSPVCRASYRGCTGSSTRQTTAQR